MPKKMSKMKEILFSLIAVFLGLTIINFLLGFVAQNRYIALDPVSIKDSKRIPGYFAPNQDKVILFPGLEDYRVRTNNLGFRITSSLATEPKNLDFIKDKNIILCLGDSETFGNHVADEDSYPYLLQDMIRERGHESLVLNASIGGGTISDYVEYMKIWGLKLNPNTVILQFFDNDLDSLKSWKISKYQQMLDANKFDLSKAIKKMKMFRAFRKIELESRYRKWIRKTKDERAKQIFGTESKALEDNLYYYAFKLGLVITDPYHEDLTDLWAEYFSQLDELVDLLRGKGTEFIFVIYPSINTLFDHGKNNYQEIFIDHFEKKGIKYIDLRQTFLPIKNQYLDIYADPPKDFHLSRQSKIVTAEEVYKLIKDKL